MRPDAVTQTEFLTVLFYGVPGDQFMEIRLLVESTRGEAPVVREWLQIGGDHAERLAALTKLGADRGAAVCFGVLPRGKRGGGKSEDTMASASVWTDIDDKDFSGGEEQARAALAGFPLPPSIVVRSGHGLHAYWLLTEACKPARLSALAKVVGKAVGGDSVHDAARVLRMPGTLNLKDPSAPMPVEIEVFEPERRVTAAELEQAALECAYAGPDETDAPDEGAEAQADKPIDMSGMPAQVDALLKAHKKLRDLFVGVGKPSHDRHGEALDQTGSGYDYSFLFELVKKHVLDPDILASALVCRPDGHARDKGVRYVRRTVERVLAKLRPKQVDVLFELGIDRVVLYDSEPVVYAFYVGERHFRLDAAGLLAPMKFTEAFLQVAGRTPAIPHKRDEWLPWVNSLIAGAERVTMPPDASAESVLHERVTATIENLALTTERAELESKGFQLEDGRRAFKPAAIRKALLDDFKDLSHAATCRVLHGQGYSATSIRISGKPTRLWTSKEAT